MISIPIADVPLKFLLFLVMKVDLLILSDCFSAGVGGADGD
jgi:hypothetical protein